MNELVKIENQNGKLVVSSRVVAEQLEREHKNVIRDLEKILSSSNVSHLIIESTYKAKTGTYKEYLLTKDGFTLYMFNIQGYNDFKLAYINEFNRMEKALQVKQDSYMIEDPIERAKRWIEEQEERKKLEVKVEQDKPKVEYHDTVLKSDKLLTTTQIAKDLGMSARKLNETLNDLGVLYKQSNTWFFYDKYQDRIPEYADYVIGENFQQLKWTELGRKWIIDLLKQETNLSQ